jgi:Histidine phosphatase superfamily (branch 2)
VVVLKSSALASLSVTISMAHLALLATSFLFFILTVGVALAVSIENTGAGLPGSPTDYFSRQIVGPNLLEPDTIHPGQNTKVEPGPSVGEALTALEPATDPDAIALLAPSPSPNPFPDRELLLVVELCRHGDRSPLYSFPNDILPATSWKEGIGQLTGIGQRAHYDLGRRLRERLVSTGFLKPTYSVDEVYIRSTTVDRTLMSAYSQMAGLFPAGSAPVTDVRTRFGGEEANENTTGLPFRWQSVPIHSHVLATDTLLIPGANCPRHVQLVAEKSAGGTLKDVVERNQDLLSALQPIVGVKTPVTLFDVSKIADTWIVDEAHNIPLPEGVTKKMKMRVYDIANWLLRYGNEGVEVNRLRSGILLNEVKQRMLLAQQRARGKLPPHKAALDKKFVLFSAHDSTVAAALAALRVPTSVNPPYNSTLIWSVYHDSRTKRMYVNLEFNGKTLRVPACEGESSQDEHTCTLESYMSSTRPATVASAAMRNRECLTGHRRKSAMLASWLSKDPVYELDSGEQSVQDEGSDSGPSSSGIVLLIVVAAVAGAALLNGKIRAQEYFQVAKSSQQADDEAYGQDRFFHDRRRDSSSILL